jgi:hypothetical protein
MKDQDKQVVFNEVMDQYAGSPVVSFKNNVTHEERLQSQKNYQTWKFVWWGFFVLLLVNLF